MPIDEKVLYNRSIRKRTDVIVPLEVTIIPYIIVKTLALSVIVYEVVAIIYSHVPFSQLLFMSFQRTWSFLAYVVANGLSMLLYYIIIMSFILFVDKHPERVLGFIRGSCDTILLHHELGEDERIKSMISESLTNVSAYKSERRHLGIYLILSLLGYSFQISSANFVIMSIGLFLEVTTLALVHSYCLYRIEPLAKILNVSYQSFLKLSSYVGVPMRTSGGMFFSLKSAYKVYHIILILLASLTIVGGIVVYLIIALKFLRLASLVVIYTRNTWRIEDAIFNFLERLLKEYGGL